MPVTMNDLTINADGVDMETLLDDWSWAIHESIRPVLLTAMGDVFAQGDSGRIYFVDTVDGSISPVADDAAAFQTLLKDRQFVTNHMFPSRVTHLRKIGKTLPPKHVYGHRHLLVLGGADNANNVEATDVSVHVSIHGQVHRQVNELPDGASVDRITIERCASRGVA